MILLISIMLLVMSSVLVLMNKFEQNNSYNIMNDIISNGTISVTYQFQTPAPFDNESRGYLNIQRNTILIRFSSLGNPKSYECQLDKKIDAKTIYDKAVEVYSFSDRQGTVKFSGDTYRYIIKHTNNTDTLVMLDMQYEIDVIRRLMFGFIITGGISVLVFFVISVFLSKWTTDPVAKAWKEQKDFIADASHELKTPLTVIDANLDVITSNPYQTVFEQQHWIENIKEETKSMSELVADLLYIAKADANKDEFIPKRFNLSETITGAALSFESLAFEKEKTLKSSIEENIMYTGDERSIKQLVGILLDNAISYSSEHGCIYLQLVSDKHKNGRIHLIVSNDGEPISKEDKLRIFERFYRSDKSRARVSGGSGLGLSIAKAIVDKHKGKISVHSGNGELTSFIVTL